MKYVEKMREGLQAYHVHQMALENMEWNSHFDWNSRYSQASRQPAMYRNLNKSCRLPEDRLNDAEYRTQYFCKTPLHVPQFLKRWEVNMRESTGELQCQ